jgi:transketolase
MDKNKRSFLTKKANSIRNEIIRVCVQNKAGHIAPSLSSVDMLVALYYKCMNYRPKEPLFENRDRLVFSKAHGCYGLYAILSDLGVIPKKEWENFYKKGSSLLGCIERRPEYGFEAGCGSLGHGLPIACGVAFGAHVQKKDYYTFCIVGDGELQEGSSWEAINLAVKHRLNNLIIIIDSNQLQAMDFIVHILDREEKDLIRRLKGFGLFPVACPGHDMPKLVSCIEDAKKSDVKVPKVIIAETIKGYGLKCMENIPKFHFRIPTDDELQMEGYRD